MATTARQQYFADETSLQKDSREFSIANDIQQKIASVETGAQVNVIETVKVNGTALIPDSNKAVDIDVPDVIDNLYSTSADDALSAKQGKNLYDYIQNIASRGRFLSNWNSATGLPATNPSESPYAYRTGDYYIISNIATGGGTNYRPDGSSYIIGQASTTVETDVVDVSDFYFYDGTNWLLLKNSGRSIAVDSSLSTTSTNPVENRVITNALNDKVNTTDVLTKTNTTSYTPTTDYHPATKKYVDDNAVAFKAFPNTFDTTHTTQDFLDSIEILNLPVGSAYLGQVSLSDMPSGVTVQGDVEVYIYPQNIIYAVMKSTDVSPYEWIVNSQYNRGWEPTNTDTTYTAGANVQISAQNVISATDTTYTASDFDIKDLADSTSLRTKWNGKVGVSADTGNELAVGANLWFGTTTDFSSIVSPDANTMYIQYVSDSPTPPSPWQPGANTIVYFPFDTDMNDHSGNNRTMTTYGTISLSTSVPNIGTALYVNYGSMNSGQFTSNTSLTISGWIYQTQAPLNDSAQVFGFSIDAGGGGPSGCNFIYANSNGPSQVSNKPGLAFFNRDPTRGSSAYNISNNTWYHCVGVYDKDTGKTKMYVNGQYYTEYTPGRSDPQFYRCISRANGINRSFYGYMSELIGESKARTAQEIADYYDLTKSNYGIS